MENNQTGHRKKFQKNYIVISVLLVFVSISAALLLTTRSTPQDSNYVELVHNPSTTRIKVELADSPQEHKQGLMNRENLDENQGMFFSFPSSELRSFWMKDTPQSLDIIFLDSNFKVINFYEATQPNQTEILYKSEEAANYVLEMKAGFADKTNLNKNDQFTRL